MCGCFFFTLSNHSIQYTYLLLLFFRVYVLDRTMGYLPTESRCLIDKEPLRWPNGFPRCPSQPLAIWHQNQELTHIL